MGYCSRVQAAALIRGGRVTLNGREVRNPEAPVRMGVDHLTVDGSAIRE